MSRKQGKTRKNKREMEEEIDENEEEMDEERDENIQEINASPFSPSMEDEANALYDIKTQLESKGLATMDDVKFILKKKDKRGQYTYVKTYWGQLPEMDEIGEKYRGGDFLVIVHASGKYQFSKTFGVSEEAYPVIDNTIKPDNSYFERVKEQTYETRMEELRAEVKMKEEESKKEQMNMTQLLMTTIQENNKLLMSTISAGRKEGSLDEIVKLITLLKTLDGDKKEGFDYNRVFDIVGNSFNSGLQLAMNLVQKKDDESIGDVLVDVVKSFAKNINPDILTKPAQPKQIEGQAQPQGTPAKLTPQQVLALVVEYFQMVKLGFDTGQELDYFVHLACKSVKYAVIKAYVLKFDNPTLENFVANTGFKKDFENEDFKNYVLDILDNIREYDKIETEDADEPEGEEESEAEDIIESEEVNDISGQGNVGTNSKDTGDGHTDNPVAKNSGEADSSGK